MEIQGEMSSTEQQYLLRTDFSYAVAALSIDVVERIIAGRPYVINQPGKKIPFAYSLVGRTFHS